MSKKRRRRVLVVTICSLTDARPACQVVGDHLTEANWNPTPYLRSRNSVPGYIAFGNRASPACSGLLWKGV